jgi:7-carboxy-7-deazaguanine synthase
MTDLMAKALAVTTLPVSEVFGPTFQGEGPYTGQVTGFVRLGLCNLSCEWCDTAYTWDRSRYDLSVEAPPTPVGEVHRRLRQLGVSTVCLSGGEPLIHHRHLQGLLTPEWTWHAETNGTITPPPWWAATVAHTSVSPKINTRDPVGKRIKPHALAAWGRLARKGQACFKFVVKDLDGLDAVAHLTDELHIEPQLVWIMPEGTTPGALINRHRLLADHILARGWHTSTRLHVLLYKGERLR